MAALNFESATLKLVFQSGVKEDGKPILATKNLTSIRSDLGATQIAQVVEAFARLSSYTLINAQMVETESLEF